MDKKSQLSIIALPGIYKQAMYYFGGFIHRMNSLGYKTVVAFEYPHKSRYIDEKPDPQLGKIGIEDNVNALCRFMDKLRAGQPEAKFILIGHSMGSMVAQMTAAKLGDKVHGMILLCPVPSREIGLFSWDGLVSFAELLKYGDFWNKPVKRSYWATKRVLYNENMSEGEKWIAYCKSVWESGRIILQVTLARPRIDESLIKIPTLVIGGGKDKLIKPHVAESVAKKYGAEISIIPEAAHDILFDETEDAVVETVHDWIQKRVY
ncbi:MAG TPA: alpha/beta hydrolase [Candidatus Moranbacteria bacterium]|jgi:pimeloyl-ACP methyl ester carboxylesterase|nr:alpha/beta hydrolase [Candidatus Moranbacteria bacterium]HOF42493.1 alpha/beta hydrolase [Candidatus Moranbacteria bacterium]HPX94605.1 alpha/beta hydrolase [Candidatus Moranbacteria bacterium]HQB59808.1 alpha/beta hydrolase [Candidatus Moranbacteria bacterium]